MSPAEYWGILPEFFLPSSPWHGTFPCIVLPPLTYTFTGAMDMKAKILRRFLILFCVVLWVCWQQYGLQATRTLFYSARLPSAFDGFRIVQLSDLHGRQYGPDHSWLVQTVQRLKPDLIAITGDLLEEDAQLPDTLTLLNTLTSIAPTCFVTGNHEWSLTDLSGVLESFSDAGVTVLQNESLLLKRGDQQILVAGVDDPCGPRDQITPQDLGATLRQTYGQEIFFLLLAHRNETPSYWAATEADLVLAGHAHGGLIRLPYLGGIIQRHGKTGFDSGLYASGDTSLYVSRGLGGKGFRLFNRPEIALIELRQS